MGSLLAFARSISDASKTGSSPTARQMSFVAGTRQYHPLPLRCRIQRDSILKIQVALASRANWMCLYRLHSMRWVARRLAATPVLLSQHPHPQLSSINGKTLSRKDRPPSVQQPIRDIGMPVCRNTDGSKLSAFAC
jgi:hypothetical protein